MREVRFAGYAAIFNRIDKGGDLIRPGAFGSLDDGWELPLLWQHNPDQRIGSVNYVKEDSRGLRVIGQLSTKTRTGRKAARLLMDGAISGLSFGYRVKQSNGTQPRVLLDLDIAEISLVSFPMEVAATVHMIA